MKNTWYCFYDKRSAAESSKSVRMRKMGSPTLPPSRSVRLSSCRALVVGKATSSMSTFIILVMVAVLGLPVESVDLTVEDFAAGTDVVMAAVSRLEYAQIFPSDSRLLRRIASVETDDGLRPPTSLAQGGIWNVNNSLFQQTLTDDLLSEKRTEIAASFPEVGHWGEVVWEDLSKPLWSALAARLILFNISEIPSASDLAGQATFWKNFYNDDGDTAEFERKVQELIKEESKALAPCICLIM